MFIGLEGGHDSRWHGEVKCSRWLIECVREIYRGERGAERDSKEREKRKARWKCVEAFWREDAFCSVREF